MSNISESPEVFLYVISLLPLLPLIPLQPAGTPGEVLGQTGEAGQLFAAATDDLAWDEEDNTVRSPQLTLQVLERQHHTREGPASEILTNAMIDIDYRYIDSQVTVNDILSIILILFKVLTSSFYFSIPEKQLLFAHSAASQSCVATKKQREYVIMYFI